MEITYKGITYEFTPEYFEGDMLNTTMKFQHEQLMYLIEIQDWITLQNRITNFLKWGGLKIKQSKQIKL